MYAHDLQVDPLANKPCARDLLEQYRALQQAEKDCIQAVRDSEWEIKEIVRTRSNQEQNITLETPYYDIVRIQVRAYGWFYCTACILRYCVGLPRSHWC